MKARLFVDTVPEPTASSMELAAAALREGEHDCVIGFGGGSPIDTAKGAAILAIHGGRMRDYKAPWLQDIAGLPIVAIPTTAGTGSEATRFTIATDDETSEKMLCAGLAYLPLIALVDYELTFTKPPRLTADTGIDALTHAIEAYVSRRANPISDLFALAAMRAIAPNLRAACADGSNVHAREQLMFGATLAGIAFSNSSVALVHGLSRPIGAHFHVPHGLSNAMLLPTVTAFSAPAAVSRYARCALAIGATVEGEGEQAAVARPGRGAGKTQRRSRSAQSRSFRHRQSGMECASADHDRAGDRFRIPRQQSARADGGGNAGNLHADMGALSELPGKS